MRASYVVSILPPIWAQARRVGSHFLPFKIYQHAVDEFHYRLPGEVTALCCRTLSDSRVERMLPSGASDGGPNAIRRLSAVAGQGK